MITSLTNNKIRHVIQLRTRTKLRKEEGLFVAEGTKMYLEAPPSLLQEIYVSESYMNKCNFRTRLEADGCEVVTDDVFKKMSDTVTPQGILCVLKSPKTTPECIMQKPNPLLLLLENIQDPGNLGTMLRTAEGAGVDGVIMSADTVDILNPKVIRSTMGSVYRVPFAYTDDICQCIRELKERKVNVYAAYLGCDTSYDTYHYEAGTAFLIGNEGNGLREQTVKEVTYGCFLPMEGKVESLNASVASAILLYEAFRQRRKGKVELL